MSLSSTTWLPRRADGDAVVLSATWRVGVRSSMAVEVRRAYDDGQAEVLLTLPDGRTLAVSAAFEAESSEWTIRTAASGGVAPFVLSCVDRGSLQPVLVTDLPAKVGLAGGTYELECCRA